MIRSYRIEGMTCEGCVRAITAAIQSQAPDAKVEVDLAAQRVSVDNAGDQPGAKAAEAAGFVYRGVVEEDAAADTRETV